MSPNVYTNYPLTQTADSVNVLLLDALNTPTRDQTYVHPRSTPVCCRSACRFTKRSTCPRETSICAGIYDLGSSTAGTLGMPLREAPTPTAAAK